MVEGLQNLWYGELGILTEMWAYKGKLGSSEWADYYKWIAVVREAAYMLSKVTGVILFEFSWPQPCLIEGVSWWNCSEGTPGSIPNPAVKLTSADGTWRATSWESRSLPTHPLFLFLPHFIPFYFLYGFCLYLAEVFFCAYSLPHWWGLFRLYKMLLKDDFSLTVASPL